MKHKKILFIGGIIVFLILAIIVTFAIFGNEKANEQKINLYFLNPVTNELSAEERIIPKGNEAELLEAAIRELKVGPKNTTAFTNAIPEDVSINQCTLITGGENGNTVEVELSESYDELKESKALLCRASIVWSLTDFDFVENVRFKVNGKPILKDDGQEFGDFNRENVVVNPVISPEKTEQKEVTLYFSDEMAMGLCREKRSIEVSQNKTLENQIVEQLIAGPSESNHYSTVPVETKIRNIKTEDSICYVDLSSDFVTKHSGGSSAEELTIYSIVNSLTELDNVNKVQFLIEGQKEESFKGHIDFSKPFSRNEQIIVED